MHCMLSKAAKPKHSAIQTTGLLVPMTLNSQRLFLYGKLLAGTHRRRMRSITSVISCPDLTEAICGRNATRPSHGFEKPCSCGIAFARPTRPINGRYFGEFTKASKSKATDPSLLQAESLQQVGWQMTAPNEASRLPERLECG